ncbi:SWIM zinc finger family protein [Actinacidiphila bryophytorum]|uniref:SWIM zinc finger family protein n=1 Tax=Actinacidiphila bryophytorum TaxID=1436133 RepID=UPI002176DEE5|nr:SWIM zinc finger family protein [Actinacidiphila bryophytorum]UWE12662.1 SWIM zinc finger domain-containing protein [Actinacidiphila bryophytorum]
MEDTEARWTADQVLALAPDAASRTAGARLAAPAPWSGTGAAGAAVWGLCAGSGSRPYQTVVDLSGPAFACSCPSRKFPCKHALGLLLLWAEGDAGPVVAGAAAPEWAEQWTAARRKKAEAANAAAAASGSDAEPEPDAAAAGLDAARKRAERRAIRVEGGAAELEQRLTDLLRSGLAGSDRAGYQQWDEIAARMVDAQAPGLATRVRELGTAAGAGGDWPSRMLEEAGLLHLLARGFLGRQSLPGPLAETVRTRIGFTVEAADVLAGPLVRAQWLVLAQYDTADDRLTTRRIWLYDAAGGQFALLLSFGAAGRAPELTLPVGTVIDADLAFHPAAVPLRAALGTRYGTSVPEDVPPGTTVGAALDSYGAALSQDPWLDAWPVLLTDVVPVPGPDRWRVADAARDAAVPLLGADHWRLASVSGGRPVTLFAEAGATGFRPLTSWTPTSPRPIPLPTPRAP